MRSWLWGVGVGVVIGLVAGGYRLGAQSLPAFQMYGTYNGALKALALASDGTISVTASGSDGAIQDGVDGMVLATVRDYANSNPLAVAITDATGDIITSFGGGTQYTQDAALTVASSVGTMALGRASAAAPADVSADNDAVMPWYLRSGAQATVLTAAGALIGGDATNGLDVDVTRIQFGGSVISQTNPLPMRLSDGTNYLTADTQGTHATSLGTITSATGGLFMLNASNATPTDVGADGDAVIGWATRNGAARVAPTADAYGGSTVFRSIDLDETEEEVKATAGTLYALWVTNTATSTRWLKCYNATAANVTVGTTTPVITLGIPGNSSDDVAGQLGAGAAGWSFDTALSCAATTGVADNDTGAPGANEVIVNAFYK